MLIEWSLATQRRGPGALHNFLEPVPGAWVQGSALPSSLSRDLPQHGTSFSLENVCRSSASAFFLEKLMMRVIFRPAALLMEPFSSARLFFFPLPDSIAVGHRGWRRRPWSYFYLSLVFPAALATSTPRLACNSRSYTQGAVCNSGMKDPEALLRFPGPALPQCTCGKITPIFDTLQHEQVETPTMFTGFSAAEGGAAVIHAQAVRV